MPNPVTHWEISGKNAKKLHDFYTKLFGWEVNANNPMNYGLVDTHSKGGINGGIPQSDQGKGVIIYVEVADLKKQLAKAEKLGGKTIVPPTVIPNMVTFALFSDPEGNVIGLVKSEEKK